MKYGKGEDVSKAMKKADRLIEDINKKKADNEEKDEEGLPKTKTGKIEDKSQDNGNPMENYVHLYFIPF